MNLELDSFLKNGSFEGDISTMRVQFLFVCSSLWGPAPNPSAHAKMIAALSKSGRYAYLFSL
jgi:hypothetical protein